MRDLSVVSVAAAQFNTKEPCLMLCLFLQARSLGWDRFSLVGHSMGGAVASLVAASFPEKVDRCVFLDILGPFAFSPGTSPKRLRTSIASRSEYTAVRAAARR